MQDAGFLPLLPTRRSDQHDHRRHHDRVDHQPDQRHRRSSWHSQFAELRSRFPGTKDSVLFCIHALQQDPGIQVDDLKAQAGMHGFRVTTASVAAAQRLLAPAGPAAAPTPRADQLAAEPGNRVRRSRIRKPEPQVDLETMLRQVVAKASETGVAKVAKMRAAIQRSIEVLRAAVG